MAQGHGRRHATLAWQYASTELGGFVAQVKHVDVDALPFQFLAREREHPE